MYVQDAGNLHILGMLEGLFFLDAVPLRHLCLGIYNDLFHHALEFYTNTALRGLDTICRFSNIFYKGDNSCDVL